MNYICIFVYEIRYGYNVQRQVANIRTYSVAVVFGPGSGPG